MFDATSAQFVMIKVVGQCFIESQSLGVANNLQVKGGRLDNGATSGANSAILSREIWKTSHAADIFGLVFTLKELNIICNSV
jgi:hypothetical protein